MSAHQNSSASPVAADFFAQVSHAILAQYTAQNLRDVVILLPNFHVAHPLAQALQRQAGNRALLLPQMVTLNEWAQTIPLNNKVTPASNRAVLLYQALHARRDFAELDCWGMAQELLALFDELTQSLSSLPSDAEAFARALQVAYQARQNTALQFEARLVHELWYVMQQGDELDAMRAYQQRLAGLAASATRPLFVLRTYDWNALEQRFLDEYQQRAALTIFDLREQSGVRQDDFPTSNFNQRLGFFAADGLEHEAAAAAMQVRCWLAEGRQSIAIVAQDRVVARRLRALLERADVLLSDETGWTFSTLSVSTVLMSWLDVLQGDFYHHDFLDLLKSPYIFADMAVVERKSAAYQLEKLVRQHGVVAQLNAYFSVAEKHAELALPLRRIQQAARLLNHHKKYSLSNWLLALQQSLQVLAIDGGWQQDEAGSQLLTQLQLWQTELAQEVSLFSFATWRRWLAQRLDEMTYRDTDIDSPVRLTHLAATRWRNFDAVIVLGADADHLPAVSSGGRWFNDAVRSSLKLPTLAMRALQQRDDLLCLLAMNERVLVTWQQSRNGEAGLLSPFLEMLRDRHQQKFADDLSDKKLASLLLAEQQIFTCAVTAHENASPVLPHTMLPNKISISAYASLVACPYQYYARYVLRLNELDEVSEALEKRDYGSRVHEVLHCFHQQYPRLQNHALDTLEAALRHLSQQVFADLLQHDFLANAWLTRWFKALPAYLAWQLAGEADGWQYLDSEMKFEQPLAAVKLYGRIDRLDGKAEARQVIDYKLQTAQSLRDKLSEPGEDVQLACYAYAYQAQSAVFVSIDGDEVKTVSAKQEIAELAQLNVDRLNLIMAQLAAGAPAIANGIEAVCGYCEMRGLCRKTAI